jgi:hypothetical protein
LDPEFEAASMAFFRQVAAGRFKRPKQVFWSVGMSGSWPKSVMVDAKSAREAGGRVKPMAQAVGLGCQRWASPRSGRNSQVRSGDFSAAKSVALGMERIPCRPSALPTDTQRPGPHSFARFAGFIPLPACSPRLAPWAFIFRPLRGLAPPPAGRTATHQGAFLAPP